MARRSDCFSLLWIVITILPEQNPDHSEALTNPTFAQPSPTLRWLHPRSLCQNASRRGPALRWSHPTPLRSELIEQFIQRLVQLFAHFLLDLLSAQTLQ